MSSGGEAWWWTEWLPFKWCNDGDMLVCTSKSDSRSNQQVKMHSKLNKSADPTCRGKRTLVDIPELNVPRYSTHGVRGHFCDTEVPVAGITASQYLLYRESCMSEASDQHSNTGASTIRL